MVYDANPALWPPLPSTAATLAVSYDKDGKAGPSFTQEKALEAWEDVKMVLTKVHKTY
jgi:hypothetical protein